MFQHHETTRLRYRRSQVVAAAVFFLVAIAAAEEPTNPTDSALTFEQKLETCAACHGSSGNTPTAPIYPRLGGQHASYLEHALKSYRAGRRNDPVMQQQVQALNLSDGEIARLADHFSRQTGLRQVRN